METKEGSMGDDAVRDSLEYPESTYKEKVERGDAGRKEREGINESGTREALRERESPPISKPKTWSASEPELDRDNPPAHQAVQKGGGG